MEQSIVPELKLNSQFEQAASDLSQQISEELQQAEEVQQMIGKMQQFKFVDKTQIKQQSNEDQEDSQVAQNNLPINIDTVTDQYANIISNLQPNPLYSQEDVDLQYSRSIFQSSHQPDTFAFSLVSRQANTANGTQRIAELATPQFKQGINQTSFMPTQLPGQSPASVRKGLKLKRLDNLLANSKKIQKANIFQISDDPEARLNAIKLVKKLHLQKKQMQKKSQEEMRKLDQRVFKHVQESRVRFQELAEKRKLDYMGNIVRRIELKQLKKQDQVQKVALSKKFIIGISKFDRGKSLAMKHKAFLNQVPILTPDLRRIRSGQQGRAFDVKLKEVNSKLQLRPIALL